MKLSKAIQILELYGVVDDSSTWQDYLDAQKLGIEALKSIQVSRTRPVPYNIAPLPGETH